MGGHKYDRFCKVRCSVVVESRYVCRSVKCVVDGATNEKQGLRVGVHTA